MAKEGNGRVYFTAKGGGVRHSAPSQQELACAALLLPRSGEHPKLLCNRLTRFMFSAGKAQYSTHAREPDHKLTASGWQLRINVARRCCCFRPCRFWNTNEKTPQFRSACMGVHGSPFPWIDSMWIACEKYTFLKHFDLDPA